MASVGESGRYWEEREGLSSQYHAHAQEHDGRTHAHPPPAGRARGRSVSKRGRQDLREVIQMKRSQLRSSGTE